MLADAGRGPDDYAVTRRGARSTSSVVDRLTARLLEQLRSPLTIVDAIIALSRAEDFLMSHVPGEE